MPDSGFLDRNGNPISVVQFHADIDQLRNALRLLRQTQTDMVSYIGKLDATFDEVGESWHAPSKAGFDYLLGQFASVKTDLLALLDDSLVRLAGSIDTYVAAEASNQALLTP